MHDASRTSSEKARAEAGPVLLKRDLLGQVWLEQSATRGPVVRRDTRAARWWLRWLARRLAAREARALSALGPLAGVPKCLSWGRGVLTRSWLQGAPMQIARPYDRRYFRQALTLMARMHRAGVVHNDTAKEPNWLVCDDGSAALIDFQLASVFRRRGRLFKLLAREDLRHLLKHKRNYCPDSLSARQRRILATPSWPSRAWMASGKRLYLWVTRRVLGWEDREGAGDRNL